MYGAILGDIIGSPYEFDRGRKIKNFKIVSRNLSYNKLIKCKGGFIL